jgi:type II secretory pathway pseudopilin PulG
MSGEKGFTYPAALLLIITVSVSLMVVQKQWSTIVKREKETELLFRAGNIMQAIGSFYQNSSKDSQQYPRSLKVLLKDNRFQGLKRHLRKIYKDPMTKDGEWGIVYDGKGGIKGVFSKSLGEPLKKGNFPEIYKSFEKKKKYSEWKFVYEPKKEAAS